jgi:hypothetical protein
MVSQARRSLNPYRATHLGSLVLDCGTSWLALRKCRNGRRFRHWGSGTRFSLTLFLDFGTKATAKEVALRTQSMPDVQGDFETSVQIAM